MKWLDSPKHLFAVLRVVAVLAIAGGLWLSVSCGVVQVVTGEAGLTASNVWYVATALVNCALWTTAWGSFLGLCTRQMQGGTAFTKENCRTMQVIGVCVCVIGGIMCVRALPGLIAAPDMFLLIEAVILPGTFVTVGLIAFILRRLLKNAMALEAEQADVV